MLEETEFRQPPIDVSRFINCLNKRLGLFIFAGLLFDNESVEKANMVGKERAQPCILISGRSWLRGKCFVLMDQPMVCSESFGQYSRGEYDGYTSTLLTQSFWGVQLKRTECSSVTN